MDALHANLFAAFDIDVEVIDENRLVRTYSSLLQSNLENLRVRLCYTHLGRDNDAVKGVIDFFASQVIAQVAPGIRNDPCFVFAAQRTDEVYELAVHNVTGEEFLSDSSHLIRRTFQPLHYGFPMLLRSDGTKCCLLTSLTIKDDPIEVVVFHTETFCQLLSRRLIFGANDDSAEIKEDCPNAHFVFFDV